MVNQVFANSQEISCKAAKGKSTASFPDVCFTPPQTAATPVGVPIPYPNTGLASDTTDGSRSVKISGKEVMLKNKSYFKTSYGDEAGCAPKKGIITAKNKGRVYFQKWSMNVFIESENVDRMGDLTTHNHGSSPGNTPPWLYIDGVSAPDIPNGCKESADNFNTHCKKHVKLHKDGTLNSAGTNRSMCADDDCKTSRDCIITPYSLSCCDGKTPHHVVPKSQFVTAGKGIPLHTDVSGNNKYSASAAPCICVEGTTHSGDTRHAAIHEKTNMATRMAVNVPSRKAIPNSLRWALEEAESIGAQAVSEVTGCAKECIESQVREGHQKLGLNQSSEVRPTTAGGEEQSDVATGESW